jgi:hypothetical protein
MQVNGPQAPPHTCEVCGREKCLHCQECGSPGTHATTCSQYVSTKVVYDKKYDLTFRLTMRNGVLLSLHWLFNDFPMVWGNAYHNYEWWDRWQTRISKGYFDHNVN